MAWFRKMDIYNELVKDGNMTMLNQCASDRNKVPRRDRVSRSRQTHFCNGEDLLAGRGKGRVLP